MSSKLTIGLEKLNFTQEHIQQISEKMDKYIKELILFNSAYNLVNTSDYDEIAVNHILDSLSAYSELKKYFETLQNEFNISKEELKIADIGSGGGLPGLPLAAAFPEYNFTLVERMDKRCAFLENEAAILGLKNVTVMKAEAEKVPEQSFHLATFRAFRPLDNKMTKTLLNLTKNNGILAAYKAKEKSIIEEMSGISEIVKSYEIRKIEVPFLNDRERNLVVIKKTSV